MIKNYLHDLNMLRAFLSLDPKSRTYGLWSEMKFNSAKIVRLI